MPKTVSRTINFLLFFNSIFSEENINYDINPRPKREYDDYYYSNFTDSRDYDPMYGMMSDSPAVTPGIFVIGLVSAILFWF